LQTARRAIVGETIGVVEQQTHGDAVGLAGFCSRRVLEQSSLGIRIAAGGEGHDCDVGAGITLDGEGRVALAVYGPVREVACAKVAVGDHVGAGCGCACS
jgi:hypothetical protein